MSGGVEFHANVYSASKQNILIVPAEPWVAPALNLLVLLLLALLLPRLRLLPPCWHVQPLPQDW